MADEQDRGLVIRLVFGHMAAQTVAAAVRLGVPDALGDGASADQVAKTLNTDPAATLRLLRALAGLEVLVESTPGQFTPTGLGAVLRSRVPGSLAGFVRMFLDPTMVSAWQHLDESVRTGDVAFDRVFGVDFFGHLDRHPELSALFNVSMRQATVTTAPLLVRAFDFSRYETVMDVGGGDGTLLSAILAAHPTVRGTLFDTPAGVAQAGDVLAAAGVADRCTVLTGDFFTAVPEGADVVLMKSIVHDWDDDRVVTILGHCRDAVPADGRVLIVELVLPDVVQTEHGTGLTYLSDLNMLVNVGGRERTRSDFENVATRAGLRVVDVHALSPHPTLCALELARA